MVKKKYKEVFRGAFLRERTGVVVLEYKALYYAVADNITSFCCTMMWSSVRLRPGASYSLCLRKYLSAGH